MERKREGEKLEKNTDAAGTVPQEGRWIRQGKIDSNTIYTRDRFMIENREGQDSTRSR